MSSFFGKNPVCDPTLPERIVRGILERPAPPGWTPSGLGREYYCDLVERIVENAAPWVDGRGAVIDPVLGREWAQTTSRFAASGAIALHFGRCAGLKETVFRAMDYACREFTRPGIRQRSPDFWMRELSVAWKMLRPMASPERVEQWRADLAAVDPRRHYSRVADTDGERAELNNWCIYGGAGESLRESFGIGGPSGALWGHAFFETYLESQFHHFNSYGMYRDPNDPITYDITTRLQMAAALRGGYRGKLAGRLDSLNRRADFALLLMLAPTGEVPFGGRSSQFHFQEGIVAALCELEASRYGDSDPRLAGAFKRQAHLSALAVREGLLRTDGKLFHLKNFFDQATRHGCDPYGHYSVYSLYAGSVFGLAALFADDTIPEMPAPSELGQYGFALEGSFEKAFASAAGNYLEFDLLANLEEDACGLGRIVLRGVPRGILPMAPFSPNPRFVVDPRLRAERTAAAVAPEWTGADGRVTRLAEKGTGGDGAPGIFRTVDAKRGLFEAEYRHEGVGILYRADIGTPGALRLEVRLSGRFKEPSLIFPLLEFDGGKQVDPFRFIAFSGTPHEGGAVANRNGLYRIFRFPFDGGGLELTVRGKRS